MERETLEILISVHEDFQGLQRTTLFRLGIMIVVAIGRLDDIREKKERKKKRREWEVDMDSKGQNPKGTVGSHRVDERKGFPPSWMVCAWIRNILYSSCSLPCTVRRKYGTIPRVQAMRMRWMRVLSPIPAPSTRLFLFS